MRKIISKILTGVVFLSASAIAAEGIIFVPAKVVPSEVNVTVPNVTRERSLVLVEPGTLEKMIFIHYSNGKTILKAKTPSCYKLLEVKWKTLPISYFIHPELENKVPGAILESTKTWDDATSKNLFNGYTIDSGANWDIDYPDGKNEYSLGNYPEEGVIGVTVVWSGVPLGGRGRQIIEYDVMFDTDYNWFDCTQVSCDASNKGMDLQNIATHETGHGLGLADVYESSCSEVTMFGYSNYGEIQKRTLESPDIAGLQKLYGK